MKILTNDQLYHINGGGINWSIVFGFAAGLSFLSGFFKSFFRKACR